MNVFQLCVSSIFNELDVFEYFQIYNREMFVGICIKLHLLKKNMILGSDRVVGERGVWQGCSYGTVFNIYSIVSGYLVCKYSNR